MDAAIEIRGVKKSYGPVQAVKGIDLDVGRGEVFALLGPNGAGKTTTVEILEGYRGRDAGEVHVLGHDPALGERALKERIGIVLQETNTNLFLTVNETIDLFRCYYPHPLPPDEAEELDDRVAIIARGEIIASGTPAEIRRSDEASRIEFRLASPAVDLPPIEGLKIDDGGGVTILTTRPVETLHVLTGWAIEHK